MEIPPFSLSNVRPAIGAEQIIQNIQHLLEKAKEKSPNIAKLFHQLGNHLTYQGNYYESLQNHLKGLRLKITALDGEHQEILDRVNEIEIKTHGENHLALADTSDLTGAQFESQGKYDEAMKKYKEALGIRIKAKDIMSIAYSFESIGHLLESQKEYEEAINCYRQFLKIVMLTRGENHPDVPFYFGRIGNCFLKQYNYEEAENNFRQAVNLMMPIKGEFDESVGYYFNQIGNCLQKQGKHKEALEEFKQALRISTIVLGENHPHTHKIVDEIGRCLQRLGKEEAERILSGEYDGFMVLEYLHSLDKNSCTFM